MQLVALSDSQCWAPSGECSLQEQLLTDGVTLADRPAAWQPLLVWGDGPEQRFAPMSPFTALSHMGAGGSSCLSKHLHC